MDELAWEEIREEFPVTNNLIYFNSAGLSPMPNRVLKAITEAYHQLNQFGDAYFESDLFRHEMLKEKLADLIGTQSHNISFAANTSTGFGMIAAALKKSMPFKFNIVSLKDEFPSSHIPFEFQGIEVKYVEPVNGTYTIKSIVDAVDEKTMAVVCSQVQYATGFRLDLQKLGNALFEMDLLFIVNATQAFPIFDIDVEKCKIDVLSVSFHKWNYSGILGSLLYTSESFREQYPAALAGWLSVKPPEDDFIPVQKTGSYELQEDGRQYLLGTINFQAFAGLDAALDFVNETGRENIRERILDLTDHLVKGLNELPVNIVSPRQSRDASSGIVLVNLKNGNNAGAVEFLRKNKIIVALRAGCIRISCNFFNNFREVDDLLKALHIYSEM
jgi:cysteine desulfurase / selenocysteine lyase